MFDARAIRALHADLAGEHPGQMADAEAMLAGLVVEEFGGERPVLGGVVGDAADLLQDRIGPQLRQVVVDCREFLVLRDLALRRAGTVDRIDRLALR